MASGLFMVLLALAVGTVASKPDKYQSSMLKRGLSAERGVHLTHCLNDGFVLCHNNSACIQKEWVCDTEKDCLDGSDELNCPANCTGPNQFSCGDPTHKCIAAEFRCDGRNDCPNGTDENNCHLFVCPPNEVKCNDTQVCMEKMWVCDGAHDCRDGSDEHNCKSCGRHGFLCANESTCIDNAKKCDGNKDCADNYDEKHCSDTPSPCQDRYSAYLCNKLNQTEHPFCLDHVYAPIYCPKFCFHCHNVSTATLH